MSVQYHTKPRRVEGRPTVVFEAYPPPAARPTERRRSKERLAVPRFEAVRSGGPHTDHRRTDDGCFPARVHA